MSDETHRRAPTSVRSPEQSLLFYHREGTKAVPFPPGSEVIVGRSFPADAVVDDASLSRKHARFSWTSDGVNVEDLDSTNGTWVNGKRVKAERIGPGDLIRLGDVTVSLHVVPARAVAGIDGNDRFGVLLEEEVRRARTFSRPVSLMMVRHVRGAHVSQWTPAITQQLRPVDHVGLYAQDTVSLLLPEIGRGQALELARVFVSAEPQLRIGIAVFPEDAGSAEELVSVVRSVLALCTDAARVKSRDEEAQPTSGRVLSVHSPKMRAVVDDLLRVAGSQLPVLVLGETGTGKELVARAIHEASPRRGQPMRSINCAAIPGTLVEGILFGHEKGAFTSAERTTKGIFEQATKSTVLLDEIGELSLPAQAALLRVLESKRVTRIGGDREIDVDVRIVAATHRDLEAMTETGQFRRDLLYRLNAVTLALPPLRERTEEIEPLARELIAEANRQNGRNVSAVEPEVWKMFQRYAWPGNVRELRNVIERAVVIARGDVLVSADLPERIRGQSSARDSVPPPQLDLTGGDFKERVQKQMARYETDLIVAALQQSGGNQTEAARLLQIPVRTLAHKMQTLGIKKRFE
jgi:DNA-binding NtrC family response regulator